MKSSEKLSRLSMSDRPSTISDRLYCSFLQNTRRSPTEVLPTQQYPSTSRFASTHSPTN
ncbi:MAG: hypothetical protein V7K48_09530 [Nostoc sp.]|uniref:hypothetical protein n=1 Tax=Nostoc sp. TaxID=1180 RepID=UPI002FF607E4